METSKLIFKTLEEGLVDSISNLDKGSIRPDSHLKNDLGLDSLSSMFLLTYLEDNISNFEVNADTIEARHFNTVTTLHDYILSEMAVLNK